MYDKLEHELMTLVRDGRWGEHLTRKASEEVRTLIARYAKELEE